MKRMALAFVAAGLIVAGNMSGAAAQSVSASGDDAHAGTVTQAADASATLSRLTKSGKSRSSAPKPHQCGDGGR